MKGSCLECRAEYRGRTDKKFCSDSCRNAYHNRLNRDCNNLVRTVNNRLRKNYRILRYLALEGRSGPFPRTRLADQGFDFESITRVIPSRQGEPCYGVYDLGYIPVGESHVRIVAIPEPGNAGQAPLFPVVRGEFQRSHHNVFAADLADQHPVLHDG